MQDAPQSQAPDIITVLTLGCNMAQAGLPEGTAHRGRTIHYDPLAQQSLTTQGDRNPFLDVLAILLIMSRRDDKGPMNGP